MSPLYRNVHYRELSHFKIIASGIVWKSFEFEPYIFPNLHLCLLWLTRCWICSASISCLSFRCVELFLVIVLGLWYADRKRRLHLIRHRAVIHYAEKSSLKVLMRSYGLRFDYLTFGRLRWSNEILQFWISPRDEYSPCGSNIRTGPCYMVMAILPPELPRYMFFPRQSKRWQIRAGYYNPDRQTMPYPRQGRFPWMRNLQPFLNLAYVFRTSSPAHSIFAPHAGWCGDLRTHPLHYQKIQRRSGIWIIFKILRIKTIESWHLICVKLRIHEELLRIMVWVVPRLPPATKYFFPHRYRYEHPAGRRSHEIKCEPLFIRITHCPEHLILLRCFLTSLIIVLHSWHTDSTCSAMRRSRFLIKRIPASMKIMPRLVAVLGMELSHFIRT